MYWLMKRSKLMRQRKISKMQWATGNAKRAIKENWRQHNYCTQLRKVYRFEKWIRLGIIGI